jgi:hypothetical protein
MNQVSLARVCHPLILAMAILAGIGQSTPIAARQTDSYDEEHYFDWATSGDITEITWTHRETARARTRTCKIRNRERDVEGITVGTIPEPPLSESQTAEAPNSKAIASADLVITTSTASSLIGNVRAHGSATPDLTGCSSKRRKRTAVARASSMSRIKIKYFDDVAPFGAIGGFNGTWRHTSRVPARNGSRSVLRDPTIVRLTDAVTGQVSVWTLSDVRSVMGTGTGETRWGLTATFPGCDGDVCRTLKNTAENMTFEYVIDAPVIPVNQRGTLRIVVENSLVTQSIKTGVFLGVGAPIVNAPKDFEFRLENFPYSYSLPASSKPPLPGHSVELSFDGGTHSTRLPDGNFFPECTIITDIGNGFDDADISAPPIGDSDLGFNAKLNKIHVAIPLAIPPGPDVELDAILVPVFQVGAPIGVATIQAAYTRLWSGDPMAGGVVIGGDMTTNRLDLDNQGSNYDVDPDIDVYRVLQNSPTNSSRRLQEAVVALDHLPLLATGSYYLELAFEGSGTLPDPEVVPCPWPEPDDRGLIFNVLAGQWQLARDSQSQRIVDFCGTVLAGYVTCEPLADGSDCRPKVCPDPNDICRPTERVLDPISGLFTVTKCDCLDSQGCYIELLEGDPQVPVCRGQHCPGRNGPCDLTATQNHDGTITYGCCEACVPPPPGMVAWWTLDETSGMTVVDIASGHNGIPSPGTIGSINTLNGPAPVSLWPPAGEGKVGGALYFWHQGNNRFVRVPTAISFATSDFSIDAWVFITQYSGTQIQPIVEKMQYSGTRPVAGYRFYVEDGYLRFKIAPDRPATTHSANVQMTQGVWHHIGVTVKRFPSEVTLYVDGSVVSIPSAFVLGDISNAADLVIGGSLLGPAINYLDIAVDELELFDRALDKAEIEAIFKAGKAGKCRGKICGMKFKDLNGDGKQDPGDELGLSGWTIQVKNANGSVIASAIADANGKYCIDVPIGTYTVVEVRRSGWVQTSPQAPASYTVTVAPNQRVQGINFGNKRSKWGWWRRLFRSLCG